MGIVPDLDYLTPATIEQYHKLGEIIRKERAEGCLTMGATCSLPEGSHFSGPRMMTTWDLDGYPLVRVMQTNPGRKIMHDNTDEWQFWINIDHAWKVKGK